MITPAHDGQSLIGDLFPYPSEMPRWFLDVDDDAIADNDLRWTEAVSSADARIKRSWLVTGHKLVGLPRQFEHRLWQVLVDQMLTNNHRGITLSYNLASRLELGNDTKSFAKIERALRRIYGVFVVAETTTFFSDGTEKTQTLGYHLIGDYLIDRAVAQNTGQVNGWTCTLECNEKVFETLRARRQSQGRN